MANEVADLQLAMKQATKEQELLQSQADSDSKAEELQTQLQELHKKWVIHQCVVFVLLHCLLVVKSWWGDYNWNCAPEVSDDLCTQFYHYTVW